MPLLTFVDVHGNEGEIDSDFDVSYDGPLEVAVPIESVVAEATNEYETPRQVFDQLMLELPKEFMIREVELSDDR